MKQKYRISMVSLLWKEHTHKTELNNPLVEDYTSVTLKMVLVFPTSPLKFELETKYGKRNWGVEFDNKKPSNRTFLMGIDLSRNQLICNFYPPSYIKYSFLSKMLLTNTTEQFISNCSRTGWAQNLKTHNDNWNVFVKKKKCY